MSDSLRVVALVIGCAFGLRLAFGIGWVIRQIDLWIGRHWPDRRTE